MAFYRSTALWMVYLLCGSLVQYLHATDLEQQFGELGLQTKPIKFHQYEGMQFELDGFSAQIIEPEHWASGKPWIWRARFWGHQPELDLALLNQGYAVAYCDVKNLYGSPKAVERWNSFYKVTQKLGLNPKPILEGMSRGGLIIFNWAKANPHLVSSIYGDNPVCDIRSWPARHSPSDWDRCLKAYGLTEQEASRFGGNPIDGLQALAQARVPLFLVLGEKDEVVPIEQNGLELDRRYRKLGGETRKWIKPGQKHHPHGLDPVTPLLNQLLLTSPRPKLQPKPVELLTDKQRILVLGDSITYSGEYVSHLATWAERTYEMEANRFINLGVPSETVSGLSETGHAGGRFPRPDLHERLDRVLEKTSPDLIIACYGINCGIYQPFSNERMEAFKQGITRLKRTAEKRGIEIVFVTPPVFDSIQKPGQSFYEGVLHHYSNWLVAKQERDWNVVDVHFEMQAMLDAKREQESGFTFQPDAVHPNAEGHRTIASALIRSFVPGFDPAELQSPEHQRQFAITHGEQKKTQRKWLEATRHLRPGIPGYVGD